MNKSRIIKNISNGFMIKDGKMPFKVRRTLGGPIGYHDPFILLDEMKSKEPKEYKTGFESHPHRGFETITYMLKGIMEHKDTKGNQGIVTPGSVQWMTAGKGIIHSEIPKLDSDGSCSNEFHGFQFWLNLSSKEKMIEPSYQNINSNEIPEIIEDDGNRVVRVIAGSYNDIIKGPINGVKVNPIFLDVKLKANSKFSINIPDENDNSFIYIYQGSGYFGGNNINDSDSKLLTSPKIGIFNNQGNKIEAFTTNDNDGMKFLLLSAKPINESIIVKGPFVLNTKEQIDQAYLDFENGILDK